MKKLLLDESLHTYKANLHCHTTYSDGRLTPAEVKEAYMEKGYSVVAFTDHDIMIPHPELNDAQFLALNGYEMEVNENRPGMEFDYIKSCHMCLIAGKPDDLRQACWHRTGYLFGNAPKHRDEVQFDPSLPDFVREYTPECISRMMQTGRDSGFFVTYNHPAWSLEDYPEYSGYRNMHAMEICNYGCLASGYDEYNPRVYDDLLRKGQRIYCIGADDTHSLNGCFGAYTVIFAPELRYEAITDALFAGNFYASQGPEIKALWFEDGRLHIRCAPAREISFTTGVRRTGFFRNADGTPVTEAVFTVKEDYGYVRATVTDFEGRHANTNAYFTDELNKD